LATKLIPRRHVRRPPAGARQTGTVVRPHRGHTTRTAAREAERRERARSMRRSIGCLLALPRLQKCRHARHAASPHLYCVTLARALWPKEPECLTNHLSDHLASSDVAGDDRGRRVVGLLGVWGVVPTADGCLLWMLLLAAMIVFVAAC
jgi:hypothetical protein